jgi:hypothetical protein
MAQIVPKYWHSALALALALGTDRLCQVPWSLDENPRRKTKTYYVLPSRGDT